MNTPIDTTENPQRRSSRRMAGVIAGAVLVVGATLAACDGGEAPEAATTGSVTSEDPPTEPAATEPVPIEPAPTEPVPTIESPQTTPPQTTPPQTTPPRTTPAQTTPAQTTPAQTTLPTAAPEPVTSDTSTGPATAASMFDGWPAPPTQPPSLESVPRLFPSEPILGTGRPERSEATISESEIGPSRHQYYFRPDAGALISIRTVIGSELDVEGLGMAQVDVEGWSEAHVLEAFGSTVVTLSDPGGHVVIEGTGVDQATTVDLARSLTRRGPGLAGWDVSALPDGFESFGQGG